MSSEGSVSSNGSRIQQFGLYRTIDARTEEFLRSSRKRQIRQGCACAAISTAITVTVVVSVILVYEYSINTEANVNKKNSFNPNWIGLINDSDITSIGSKFNKKINFDRTTLKLLPILLKALNKNRYLEKILEEYSSTSPYSKGKDSNEVTFTRNVFSDSKNWLKLPTTRHYTPDYKTPLIQWKTPTQRLEYLTKIRKIRDYQRMLNYFDKMINDKVGINQRKEFEYTENPLAGATVPMKKMDLIKKIQQLNYPVQNVVNKKEIKTEDKENLAICNCPKKLGLLLNKLITALQDLIPHMIGNKLSLNNGGQKSKPIEVINKLITARTVRPMTQRINDLHSTIAKGFSRETINKSPKDTTVRKCCVTSTTTSTVTATTPSTVTATTPSTVTATTPSSITTTTPSTTTPDTTTSKAYALNEFKIKYFEDNMAQVPRIKNIEITNHQTFEKTSMGYDLLVKPTKSLFAQTTKGPDVKHRTPETVAPISTEKLLKTYTVDSTYSNMNVPIYKEEDYDEYFNNKHSKTTKFENLDVRGMESLKTKPVSFHEDIESGIGDNEINLKETSMNVKTMNFHPAAKQKDLDLTSMRKLADMIYLPHEKITKVWKYTIEPEPTVPSDTKYKYTGLQANPKVSNSVESSVEPTTSDIFSSALKNVFNIKTTSSPTIVKNDHFESTSKYQPHSFNTDQQSNDNVGDNVGDEFQDEYLRPTDSTMTTYKYKDSTKKNATNIEKVTQPNPWELLKNEEKIVTKSFKSMLPSMRPIYLEIQRNNEWKQEEHGDYDIDNFNNNIFDLPNIT